MKYYFVSYKYQTESMQKWETSNLVVDKHPVVWLKETLDAFRNKGSQYQIMFYDEIEKEHYDLINGWID